MVDRVRFDSVSATDCLPCTTHLKSGREVRLDAFGPLIQGLAALDDNAWRERPPTGAANFAISVCLDVLDGRHHVSNDLVVVEGILPLKSLWHCEELNGVVEPIVVPSGILHFRGYSVLA
jgi:hypothetical protein